MSEVLHYHFLLWNCSRATQVSVVVFACLLDGLGFGFSLLFWFFVFLLFLFSVGDLFCVCGSCLLFEAYF